MQILDIHNSNHTWMNILFLQLGQIIILSFLHANRYIICILELLMGETIFSALHSSKLYFLFVIFKYLRLEVETYDKYQEEERKK